MDKQYCTIVSSQHQASKESLYNELLSTFDYSISKQSKQSKNSTAKRAAAAAAAQASNSLSVSLFSIGGNKPPSSTAIASSGQSTTAA